MTLRTKISFLIALLITIMFGIAATVIYALFADFRKEEFQDRLNEKAISSIKLLVEVAQVDKQLLKIIDQNSINKLYDEKTLIFDANYKLIYSSIDDAKINWSVDDLKYLKKHNTFFKKDGQRETYGVFYDTNDKDYYALISASDHLGERKLQYLLYILISTYIVFTGLCWIAVFFSVKILLQPLNNFHHRIKGINENNLDTRIAVKNKKDEIDLLANEFNMMLQRIDESYQKQKEFTSHASHELRTPIARVTSQLENKVFDSKTTVETKNFFNKLLSDVNQISELISSLLLLSRLDSDTIFDQKMHRIDELIYETTAKLTKIYPEFKINFNIDYTDTLDSLMEVKGSKSLLEIALINLLKNACVYSNDNQAIVSISEQNGRLKLTIANNGNTLNEEEQKNMFQPFTRGKNAKGKSGLGLGLRIVERILSQHHVLITYNAPTDNQNVFILIFMP